VPRPQGSGQARRAPNRGDFTPVAKYFTTIHHKIRGVCHTPFSETDIIWHFPYFLSMLKNIITLLQRQKSNDNENFRNRKRASEKGCDQ
jgi:hypothetical protein